MDLKTTAFIDALNTATDTNDRDALEGLIRKVMQTPNRYSPLEWMALGRARIVHFGRTVSGWYDLDTSLEGSVLSRMTEELSGENRAAYATGIINARLARDDLTHKWRENYQDRSRDLSDEFLAALTTISAFHTDVDVRHVADCAGQILLEKKAKQMGLMPE